MIAGFNTEMGNDPEHEDDISEILNANRLTEFCDHDNNAGSLYSPNYIDFKNEPMFLGTGRNTQRFDNPKYPFFDKSNDTQQGFDWKHDEIPLITDKKDFGYILKNAEKYIVTRNLQKLIFLDSIQGRGPLMIFGQITTLPELENVILTWEYFEGAKHSRTYTEMLRAYYEKPDEIFDESFTLPALMKIASKIRSVYDRAYFNVIGYIYKEQRGLKYTQSELKELKESIVMLWVEINILEGMRFYPGFAAMWGLKESQDLMSGLSENLQFICRDENEHLALTQFVIKLLKKDESEGFTQAFEDLQDDIEARFIEAYFEEVDWINDMFKEGSYIGMNADILIQYLNYITIRRMKSVGYKPTKDMMGGLYITKNPIPWIQNYINMDKNEKLPQEEKILNYVTGAVDQNMDGLTDLMKRLLGKS